MQRFAHAALCCRRPLKRSCSAASSSVYRCSRQQACVIFAKVLHAARQHSPAAARPVSRRCAACSRGAQSGCRPRPCRAAPPGTGSRSGRCSSSTPCGCCCLQGRNGSGCGQADVRLLRQEQTAPPSCGNRTTTAGGRSGAAAAATALSAAGLRHAHTHHFNCVQITAAAATAVAVEAAAQPRLGYHQQH